MTIRCTACKKPIDSTSSHRTDDRSGRRWCSIACLVATHLATVTAETQEADK